MHEPIDMDDTLVGRIHWLDRRVVLIYYNDQIDPVYANKEKDKTKLVEQWRDKWNCKGIMLVAWPGEWSQDIFYLYPGHIDAVLKALDLSF